MTNSVRIIQIFAKGLLKPVYLNPKPASFFKTGQKDPDTALPAAPSI